MVCLQIYVYKCIEKGLSRGLCGWSGFYFLLGRHHMVGIFYNKIICLYFLNVVKPCGLTNKGQAKQSKDKTEQTSFRL